MAGSSKTNETTQALSQYKYADITKRDIMNALSQYKDLRPELEKYYFGDGTTKNLLNLNGTIPVKYEGDEYNIPIIVWLLDTYPYNSPMVYVKPTRNMYIKANNNVHSDGNVDIPYLRVWRYPHSDLLGLIKPWP
ncbi:tumor susceptibility gene 101 protein-like [Saccostrea cucullata]|uniref:tumor susceptibility gene 101 protein-like n=1 Tax=Saccostrea cuccullata TaxID=36930 RepID=UPI002ED1FBB2